MRGAGVVGRNPSLQASLRITGASICARALVDSGLPAQGFLTRHKRLACNVVDLKAELRPIQT